MAFGCGFVENSRDNDGRSVVASDSNTNLLLRRNMIPVNTLLSYQFGLFINQRALQRTDFTWKIERKIGLTHKYNQITNECYEIIVHSRLLLIATVSNLYGWYPHWFDGVSCWRTTKTRKPSQTKNCVDQEFTRAIFNIETCQSWFA